MTPARGSEAAAAPAIKDALQISALLASVVLWVPGLLCWPAQGVADGAPAASTGLSETRDDLAEALRQGVEAYERGDLGTARRAFELVHARAPTARTLRSLGLVAFREARYADAVALLEAGLASQVKPLTESQREGAAAVLREARAKASEAGDAAAPSPPAPTVAPPAEVPVAAAQPLGPRVREPAVTPTVAGPGSLHGHDARGLRLERAGYAMLGIAGAALITSVTSYLVGLGRLREIEDDCREGCELEYVREREHSANLAALGTLSLATGISAGLLGASGTTILLWRRRSEQAGAARTELGLGWQGVF
jgi:hypothetical protein